jgi:hypothetical protein
MKIAKEMVDTLPEQEINVNTKILDIASKQGEFTRALYNKFGDKIKTHIYAIPTSSTTYEFTRKIYTLLGMPIENVFSDFNSYDLINKDKNETIIKKLTDMKFDVIIGNPPYQEINKGNGNGADPIYHLFFDKACMFGSLVTFIHPARFLFNAGKTPKEWNQKMLHSNHYKVIKYWADSSIVFPSVVDIKGGLAITLWDKNKVFDKIGTFVIHPEIQSILTKVRSTKLVPFATIVYQRDLYRLTDSLYNENSWAEGRQSKGHKYDVGSSVFDVFPELFLDEKPSNQNGYVQIYGRQKKNRVLKWIKRNYLKAPDNFEYYKIFLPKSNGTGTIGETLSTPVLGMPNVGSTLTFLSIGRFNTQEEAMAVLKYIKTKFARTLLGTLKVTQDNPRETWQNVPLQDFTSKSDINWNKSIQEIDKQLYAKYHLSKGEIKFIESKIKPME